MTIDAKDFIKKMTTIPETFVDEFFNLYDENTFQTDFVIDLSSVAKWLKANKYELCKTLKASYKKDIDYIIEKTKNPVKKYGRNNNHKTYFLTPDCFKRLALMSKSKNAEMVRTYFIEIESLFIKYRMYTLDGIQKENEKLERNQRNKTKPLGPGFIYILRASDSQTLYKIGRTKDLAARLRGYQTGLADDVEVLYLYKTEDTHGVETCVKNWLKPNRYRKYKEVYKADIDLIKMLISKCGSIGAKLIDKKDKSTQNGGYFVAITSE